MSQPFVSIIIPAYNVQDYIAQTIESCANQSFSDIEIIIVDDCGSDETITIAQAYATADARIKIVRNTENMKLLHARAEGAKAARGKYVMFVDADDVLESHALQRCVEAIKGGGIDTNIDMIMFNHKLWHSDHMHEVRCYRQGYYPNIDMFYYYLINISGLCWNIWGKLIRRELYLRAFALIDSGHKLNIAEDALIYFACTSLARSVLTLSEPLLLYRQREDSISRTKTLQQRTQSFKDHQIVSQTIARVSAELAPHASVMQRLYMRKYLSNALLSTQNARFALDTHPTPAQIQQHKRYHKRFLRAHRARKILSRIVWLWVGVRRF